LILNLRIKFENTKWIQHEKINGTKLLLYIIYYQILL